MTCAGKSLASLIPFFMVCGWNLCLYSGNAMLPSGAPSDPWSLDGAWNVTSATRTRWSLNGLWGFRPALTNDAPDVVPDPEDNWGWGKIPSVWDTVNTKTGKAQDVWMSDWCAEHGVSPFARDRAWYRRDFIMPSEAAGKRIVLTFTMLQTRAVVYVDGIRAAELSFPGGEADITDFAKPGRKQSIILDVTAYWPDSKMVDFRMPHGGGLVQRKGVTGDVYLDIRPKDSACIADATVESDVVGGKVTFAADIDIAGGVRQSPSPVRLVAKITDIDNNPVCEFTSGEVVPNADGRIEFTADWTDARRWDVHTPGNRYVCRLEMHDRDGRM